MIKEWISSILTTVPFYGNVVRVPYKAKASDKKMSETKFVAIKIDLGERGIESRSLLLTDSDITEFKDRFTKYVIGEFKPVVGNFIIKTCVQASTQNRAKPTSNNLILGSIQFADDGSACPIALTKGQYGSMQQRYEKMRGKLEYSLSIRQRIAIFLSKFFGMDEEICEP